MSTYRHQNALNIASLLLEDVGAAAPAADPSQSFDSRYKQVGNLKGNVPIRIQTPQGIVDGLFTGYFDMRQLGKGIIPTVAYDKGGKMSHGRLQPGDQILTRVPSFEEWSRTGDVREDELPKGCQGCAKVYNPATGQWQEGNLPAGATHGVCPDCKKRLTHDFKQPVTFGSPKFKTGSASSLLRT